MGVALPAPGSIVPTKYSAEVTTDWEKDINPVTIKNKIKTYLIVLVSMISFGLDIDALNCRLKISWNLKIIDIGLPI
jgi:hypothetical protein